MSKLIEEMRTAAAALDLEGDGESASASQGYYGEADGMRRAIAMIEPELARLESELATAQRRIAELEQRDAKWMRGVEDACGRKICFDPLTRDSQQGKHEWNPTLHEFVSLLKAEKQELADRLEKQPYWLIHSLARACESMNCEGEDPTLRCYMTELCVTEYCPSCAARVWLGRTEDNDN